MKKEKNAEIKEEIISHEETEKQNKLLMNVLIVSGIVFIVFLSIYFIIGSLKTFEYRGVKVNIVEEIAPYRIGFPTIYNGQKTEYYFYLRNDPRELDKEIPFEGELNLKEDVVINGTEFNCDGDGVIAIANFLKFYKFIDKKVMRDENASCDAEGRYMFIQIQEGNETKIEQFGLSCYNIDVANCEILKATERFMTETFVEVNEKL